ncbi:hypothetical protein GCM10009771_18780 [Nesterenkonia flava]
MVGEKAGGTVLARCSGDSRTVTQREADLFTALLTGAGTLGQDGEGAPACSGDDAGLSGAKIAIMIPAETLTGARDTPVVSADRAWALPADQARVLARAGCDPAAGIQHEWYTLIYQDSPENPSQGVDPDPLVPKNLLTITYEGHDPPARLRDAPMFRDGTCQAAGCTVPAVRCDLDHQRPWSQTTAYETAPHEGGPGASHGATTASNLWHLCRRHHRMKSQATSRCRRNPAERLPLRVPPGPVPPHELISEAELGAASLRNQVKILGVLRDEGAHHRAIGQNAQTLLAGLVQRCGDQAFGKTLSLMGLTDFSVGEGPHPRRRPEFGQAGHFLAHQDGEPALALLENHSDVAFSIFRRHSSGVPLMQREGVPLVAVNVSTRSDAASPGTAVCDRLGDQRDRAERLATMTHIRRSFESRPPPWRSPLWSGH